MSQDIGTLTRTWNDAGTTFYAISMDVTNTASAAGSMLQRLSVGGVTKFSVDKDGGITGGAFYFPAAGQAYISLGAFYMYYSVALGSSVGGVAINDGQSLNFRSGTDQPVYTTSDCAIQRSAAGIVEVNNCTKGTLADILARTFKNTPVAFGSLPSAATVGSGARAFINDALTPAFGSAAVGGGAVAVPVYSDGTNWIVG